MKKKKLNQLSLKKRTISNLNNSKTQQANGVNGASGPPCLTTTTTIVASWVFGCGGGGTDPNTQGCSEGCTEGCDETFTCPDWSCNCNEK